MSSIALESARTPGTAAVQEDRLAELWSLLKRNAVDSTLTCFVLARAIAVVRAVAKVAQQSSVSFGDRNSRSERRQNGVLTLQYFLELPCI
jgi:hypothetical protein